MKKTICFIIVFALAFCFIGCSKTDNTHKGQKELSDVRSSDSELVTRSTKPTVSSTAETPSPEPDEPASYLGALSETQKGEILEFAKKWYAENFSEYEVLSMDFAEDDDNGYAYYSDLKPGEIIILKVHTTHGSRVRADGTIDGIPRDFFVKITGSGYEFLNEGY